MKPIQQSYFLPILLLATIGLVTNRCTNAKDAKIIPLEEGYKPDHVIEFPHEIHTKKGIDCKYCHNSEIDGKKAGIPSENICMKCHKQVTGNFTDKKEN